MRRGENIYKRSEGRWEGRYVISRDTNGKAAYHSVYAPTYIEVKEKLQKHAIIHTKNEQLLFEELAEQWLTGVKLRCKLSTYNKYLSTYNNHLYSEYKGKKITDISSNNDEEFIAKKEELSSKTKADILSLIKQIMKYAEKCDYYVDHI